MEKENKPRLVFFQWRHDNLPKFLRLHMQLHVKCLSQFFDVVVINRDCDYQQVCDTYQPDLALFESGYRTTISNKIAVKNTSAYPQIPKLGLHNGDAWCDCRSGFISDMEHWGIETFFSICTTTAEHTPEIEKKLYVWPNFIDSDIYCDYGEHKIIPVMINGNVNPLYPWRQKIHKLISESYPSLIFPHLGYESRSPLMIYGEQYARAINASWFVPTCGTIAKEVVRKHFEIPGSKSCLVTEKSASLEAAGFIDMQNCVFATEKDILDKVNYLFQNQNELEKIINAGYQLVHSRHTLKQRNQIFQWFKLFKDLQHNQSIIQKNPFEQLSIVDNSLRVGDTPIKCNGLHLRDLHKGDEKLWAGNYDEAETLYLKCLNSIFWMSEPKLKLAICNLYKGRVHDALKWISEPIRQTLYSYHAVEPDPIEWTYFVICLLCQGKLGEAVIRVSQFPSLSHPELNRIRWVIKYLQTEGEKIPPLHSELLKSRLSIHQLPQSSFDTWINNLCTMLNACKQPIFQRILTKNISSVESGSKVKVPKSNYFLRLLKNNFLLMRVNSTRKLNTIFEALNIPNRRTGLPSISINDYIIRLGKWVGLDLIKRKLF